MTLVEGELTRKNVERARSHAEFEKRGETELKLVPTNPEQFIALCKEESLAIEQLYLSTPHDEFSLRVRQEESKDGLIYTATLKDRGELVDGALKRTEITTPISEAAYARYKEMELPGVTKQRTTLLDGVTVDFYTDSDTPVVVEVEHTDADVRGYLVKIVSEMSGSELINESHNPSLTAEQMAFKTVSSERIQKPESLDAFTQRVFAEMVAHYVSGKQQVVVSLAGMSGSGKSTVTKALQEQAVAYYGEALRPIVLSTDDYHFGKTLLETRHGAPYAEWDAAKTYDTTLLAEDVRLLMEGYPIAKRRFDFSTEEPAIEQTVHQPSPFIIIEGLYAGSKDLEEVRDLHFKLPTSIATSIGRDARRLLIEDRANDAFPTPEDRFRYQMEVALPAYLDQESPRRRGFSACARPMAERAFMLERLG